MPLPGWDETSSQENNKLPSWDETTDHETVTARPQDIGDMHKIEYTAPNEAGDVGEAIGMGVANVAGLVNPLAPASAAVEKGITNVFGNDEMKRQVNSQSIPQLAQETRQIAAEDAANHPAATLVGKAAPLMAMGPVGAAGVGARMAEGAIIGAASGGETIPQRLGGAAIGAVTAGTVHSLPKIGSALSETANNWRAAMTKLGSGDVPRTAEDVQALGRLLESQGVIDRGPVFLKTVAKKSQEVMDRVGSRIKQIFRSTPEERLPLSHVYDTVEAKAMQDPALKTAGAQDMIRGEMEDFVKGNLRQKGLGHRIDNHGDIEINPEGIWEIGKDIESAGRVWERATDATSETKGAVQRAVGRAMRETSQELIANAKPELITELQEANKTFSALHGANDGLQKQYMESIAGRTSPMQGRPNSLMGAAGKPLGSFPVKTAVTAATDNVGKFMQSFRLQPEKWGNAGQVLAQAAQRSPAAFASTWYVLSKQKPELQQLMEVEGVK